MSALLANPAASAAYVLLALSVILLVARRRNFSIGAACIAAIAAFFGGLISIEAVLALAVFLVLCLWHFGLRSGTARLTFPGAIVLSSLLVVVAAYAFAGHHVPGFHNARIIDKMVMSEGGVPFSMYLNFDKVAAAWILAVCGGLFPTMAELRDAGASQADARRSFAVIALCLAGCLAATITVSTAAGYIKFDPKIMPFFWIWAANNLIFVAFSEEILFRGMIQGSLETGFKCLGWSAYAALAVAALLFGLSHIYGGWTYVGIATLAGLFYGAAFMKTGRVEAAIAVHFLLNFAHALFFTYPALFK